MKIEIELSDLEAIQKTKMLQEEEIKKLKTRIKELDAEDLEEKAIKLSKILFEKYITKVFESLGFSEGYYSGSEIVKFPEDYQMLHKNWYSYHKDKIQVTLSANVSDKFRHAFMRIRIDTTKFENPENKNLLDEIE